METREFLNLCPDKCVVLRGGFRTYAGPRTTLRCSLASPRIQCKSGICCRTRKKCFYYLKLLAFSTGIYFYLDQNLCFSDVSDVLCAHVQLCIVLQLHGIINKLSEKHLSLSSDEDQASSQIDIIMLLCYPGSSSSL